MTHTPPLSHSQPWPDDTARTCGRLSEDENFRAVRFWIIDFVGTTPLGHRPEPVESASSHSSTALWWARCPPITGPHRLDRHRPPGPHSPPRPGLLPAGCPGQPPPSPAYPPAKDDLKITARLFRQLPGDAARRGLFASLTDLIHTAGRPPKASQPHHPDLF